MQCNSVSFTESKFLIYSMEKRHSRSNTLPPDLTPLMTYAQTTIHDNSKHPTNFLLTPLP